MALEDNTDDKKLAQFYYFCKTENVDINTWISQNELVVNSSVSCKSYFSGFTPLHIAVYTANRCAVKILLKKEADCTFKNAEGQTPIHLCMRMILFDHCYKNNLQLILDDLLSFHANLFSNSIDNNGLSHFHIACFADKVNIVEKFLKNGTNVNNAINFNSPFWAGYSPLHIATSFLLKDTIDMLLQYGANVKARNSDGLNPLHIAIQRLSVPIIKLLFSSLNSDDREGLSILHLMSLYNDPLDSSSMFLDSIENVNIFIKSTWPFWCGYTPLHVAVFYKNMYMVRRLISLGADINAKDAQGISPLQLAMDNNIITKDLMSFLLSEYEKRNDTKSICDLVQYKFFTACMSCDKQSIQQFLDFNVNVNSSIPSEYPLILRGYTPLHLLVECGNLDIIELLLKNHADLCLQNSENLSPVHLAYKRGKYRIAKKILSFHQDQMKNPINNDGLSHLHIACRFNMTDIVSKFLQNEEVNLVTKLNETPLHFAARFNAKEAVELLLNNNADFTIQEKNSNSTPLHIAFQVENDQIINMILAVHEKKLVNPINNVGLSHFHIICKYNKVNIAEKFLLNGLNKNDIVAVGSKSYAGFTPLHFAAKFKSVQIANVLLHHGANLSLKDAKEKTPLHYFLSPELSDAIDANHSKIRENENVLSKLDLMKIPKLLWIKINENKTVPLDDTGLTAFHVACIKNDMYTVQDLLDCGFDVNSCISLHCSQWSGFSPLHFAIKYESIETVMLLLKHKATNVNIQDKYGSTPLHLAFKIQNNEIIRILLSKSTDRIANIKNEEGLSYFHIACMENMIDTVNGFLQKGVNVNDTVNPFSQKFAGFTSLHIAVKFEHVEILQLLLKFQANANAVTSEGDSPLHLCHYSDNRDKKLVMIHELLKFGANPNAKDMNGNTVIELAIKKHEEKIVEIALKYVTNFNTNLCRCLELAVIEHQNCIVNLLLNNGAIAATVAEDGSTFIHKMTLTDQVDEVCFLEILTMLLERGCDLDAVDSSGRTALHCSYWPMNLPKLRVLLSCGADIDVEDRSGRTIVSYYFEIRTSRMPLTSIYRVLWRHLEVRRVTGFPLSRNNETLYASLLEEEHDAAEDDVDVEVACGDEMERMKKLRFGYYSLYQLFRNTRKMATHLERNNALASFLKSSNFREQFPLCDCVLMMQYRAAMKRKDLLFPATVVLDRIVSLVFPELAWITHCSEVIIAYLDDEDLINLQNIL